MRYRTFRATFEGSSQHRRFTIDSDCIPRWDTSVLSPMSNERSEFPRSPTPQKRVKVTCPPHETLTTIHAYTPRVSREKFGTEDWKQRYGVRAAQKLEGS
jgi:hypothetical protein